MTSKYFFVVSILALVFRWAQDYYEFAESQLATVELVTDSMFEVAHLTIQGFPRQIHDGHPNHFPSLVLPGPAYPGKEDSRSKWIFCYICV